MDCKNLTQVRDYCDRRGYSTDYYILVDFSKLYEASVSGLVVTGMGTVLKVRGIDNLCCILVCDLKGTVFLQVESKAGRLADFLE